MTEPRIVLNRTGLIQLSAGMVALLGLGFLAGAVVGYGAHVDPVLQSAVEGLAVAANGEAMTCLPAESASSRLATAESTPNSRETAGSGEAEPVNLNRSQAPAEAVGAPLSGRAAETARALSGDLARTAASRTLPTARDDGAIGVGEASPAAASVTGRFAVQLGVFGVESNADRFARGLRGRGYDPLVVAARNRSGQWMKRVHLSVFDSEESALAAAETFITREGLPAVVVMYDEGQR